MKYSIEKLTSHQIAISETCIGQVILWNGRAYLCLCTDSVIDSRRYKQAACLYDGAVYNLSYNTMVEVLEIVGELKLCRKTL